MALHGHIKVNEAPVGAWSARRLTPAPDPDGTAEYDWHATMYADDPPRVLSGRLRHCYADGALALATAVLVAAHDQRRTLPGTAATQ